MYDIIFGASNQGLCKCFAKEMQSEIELSMIGELTFFLDLQVKQCNDEIFINQAKKKRISLRSLGFKKLERLAFL